MMDVAETGVLPSVLLVEDDAPTRLLLRAFLGDDRYTISEAASSKEAFTIITQQLPQVVILDIDRGAATGTGLRLYQQVRERPDLAGVQFIVMTGFVSEAFRARARALGLTSYLTKPFRPDELVAEVGRLLGR